MGFSFAVLLSIITKKRRKPRLQEFRDCLAKKDKRTVTLYQYPSKILFCIVGVLIVGICLQWFMIEFRTDLIALQQPSIGINKSFKELTGSFELNQAKQKTQLNAKTGQALEKLRKTINLIHICEISALVSLIFNLQLKIVRTNKRGKLIQATTYLRLGFKRQKTQYNLNEGDKIQIWEMGENRFTNTNYYYSIRVVNEKHSWEIIKKSSIFSARTATIELGFLHSLPYTTRIINMTHSEVQQHQ